MRPLRAILVSALLASLAVSASAAEWIDTARGGEVTYFLFASPAEVARFDGATGQWLPRIPLETTPAAIAADEGAVYVAFGTAVYRVPLDGGASVLLGTMAGTVQEMNADGDALLVAAPVYFYDGWFVNLDKHGGGVLGSRDHYWRMIGISIDPIGGWIYARTSGISPSDIQAASLDSDEQIGAFFDSPYPGTMPEASRTFAIPSGGRVIDDSGTVYRASDLVQVDSLAGAFDALVFAGDAPVVLRDARLTRYSAGFAALGSHDLEHAGDEIALAGDSVYVFRSLGSGQIETVAVALAALVPPIPATPPSPLALDYAPDEITTSDDGTIFLLSSANRAVFRWSLTARDYLSSIAAAEAPAHIAWLDGVDNLFLGYPSGRISRVRVETGLGEEHFTNSVAEVLSLGSTGDLLLVCDNAGSFRMHYAYDGATGLRTGMTQGAYNPPDFTWSESLRRSVFMTNYGRTLAYQDVAANGALAGAFYSAGDHAAAPNGAPTRIRINPSGTVAVFSDGVFRDLATLATLAQLSHDFEDAAWVGSELFTVVGSGSTTTLEEWNPYREVVASATLPGDAPRIFAFANQLVVVTQWNGHPRFTVLAPAPGDLDGDGVPDAADALPADRDETSDRDGDTVGDNGDAFPDNPAETADSDGDGIGDNTDAFPVDPDEGRDSDGDGIGDGEDAFPLDPSETVDRDDDGIGDNGDAFPDLTSGGDAELFIDQRMKVSGYGRFGGGSTGEFHVLPEQVFALCSEGECDFGATIAKGKKNNKWALAYSSDSIAVLGEVLEGVVEDIVASETGEIVDIEVNPATARVKATAKLARNGAELRTTLTVKFTGTDVGRNKKLTMSYSMKALGPFTPAR